MERGPGERMEEAAVGGERARPTWWGEAPEIQND
jgi:hypothetical protein